METQGEKTRHAAVGPDEWDGPSKDKSCHFPRQPPGVTRPSYCNLTVMHVAQWEVIYWFWLCINKMSNRRFSKSWGEMSQMSTCHIACYLHLYTPTIPLTAPYYKYLLDQRSRILFQRIRQCNIDTAGFFTAVYNTVFFFSSCFGLLPNATSSKWWIIHWTRMVLSNYCSATASTRTADHTKYESFLMHKMTSRICCRYMHL